MPRTATIGPAIFEQVNTLVADGKSRAEAFTQVARERKSRPGTVSANYYRVARQQGQGRKRGVTATRRADGSTSSATQRRVSSAQQGRHNGRTSSDGDLASLAKQIAGLTQELVRRVEERDRRLRELVG
jgi:hypothetical protein